MVEVVTMTLLTTVVVLVQQAPYKDPVAYAAGSEEAAVAEESQRKPPLFGPAERRSAKTASGSPTAVWIRERGGPVQQRPARLQK